MSPLSPLRVVVLDMQPITPAVGGGRLRLLGLYHALGPRIETTYVGSYDWPGEKLRELRLSDSFAEIDVPLADQHFRCEAQWRAFADSTTIIDVAFPLLGRLSAAYVARALSVAATADVVVFSHPWVHPLIADSLDAQRQTIVYDSHNAEALLRCEQLESTPFRREIAKAVTMTELFLARDADIVVGCSSEDLDFYREFLGVPPSRLALVANGVFVDTIRPPTPEQRHRARMDLHFDAPTAVFVGSNYRPNAEAVEYLVRAIAPAAPEMTFAVCGGVCDAFAGAELPPANVRLFGRVSDEEKLRILHAADIAVNPMFTGSGTNIKMFDYMAAALPIVSTVGGARGICDATRAGVVVCEPQEIGGVLSRLASDRPLCAASGQANRLWAESEYSWERLSPSMGSIIRCTHDRKAIEKSGARGARRGPGHTNEVDRNAVRATGERPWRLAIFSTLGIRCGIAEYTSDLAQALLSLGVDVTIIANLTDGHEASQVSLADGLGKATVERIWTYDSIRWIRSDVRADRVAALVASRRIDHLNIQYHQGFFSEVMLIALLRAGMAVGVGTSVSLHNSTGASLECLEQLASMRVDVFVHRPAERDRLRQLGVRAWFLPLGVRERSALKSDGSAVDWRSSGPLLATFGFLRQHKGLLELVEAIDILRSIFPGVRLLAQTALYPSEDSSNYLAHVRRRITELDLVDAVIVDSSYVDIEVAMARLAEAAAVILPYAESEEGASAAAAAVLAARRPLIVTRAKIFDELRSIAYSAEDNSPPVLAAAIAAVVGIPGLRAQLEANASRATDERRWPSVARRLLETIGFTIGGGLDSAAAEGSSQVFFRSARS